MGSTLRSLILAYKADTKDFRKGSEQVKAELRAVKDHVGTMDKALAKSFGKVEPIQRMRNEIRQLSAEYQRGALSLRAYGEATDNLRAKIAKVQTNRDLRSNYQGSMTESRDSIMARMNGAAPGAIAAANSGRSFGGGGLGGLVGPLAGAFAIKKLVGGTMRRIDEVAGGAESSFLKGSALDAATGGKAAVELAKNNMFDAFGFAIGKLGDALTGGSLSAAQARARESSEANARASEKLEAWSSISGMRQAIADQKMMDRGGIDAVTSARDAAEQAGNYARVKELNEIIAQDMRDQVMSAKQLAEESKARKTALGQVENDLERQLRIERDIDKGMSERAAILKEAGGSPEQIARANALDKELELIREKRRLAAIRGDDWGATIAGGVDDMMRQAADQVKAVDAFQQRFENPAEQFKRRAEEIRKMRDMGLSPEIMERAVKANAAMFAGSQAGNFGAANVISGSAESMKLAEQAKIGDRQEKGIEKLVKIQEEALKNAKENKPLEINVTNVSI